MLKSYLRLAIRHLLKKRSFSFINIAGLSSGMAVALLIGLWVHDELSFNTTIPNYTRIGNVERDITFDGVRGAYNGAPYEMEAELRTKYGRYFKHIVLGTYLDKHVLVTNGKSFSISGGYMGEEVSQLLSLHFLEGNPNGLHDPSSIFLSASTAKALYGNASPIGNTLKIDSGLLVQVTGVYQDLPYNSDFRDLAFIAPANLYYSAHMVQTPNPWRFANLFDVYVQLADGAGWNTVNEKIRNIRRDKMDLATFNADKQYQFVYPMSRWHLYDAIKLPDSREKVQYVWLMGFIGIFILLLACINFMNLSTAKSEQRAKEVGIRKTIGSLRGQIILQFFSESLFAVGCSLFFCLLWVQLLLPAFNGLTDKNLSIPWTDIRFWSVIGLVSFFTGIIAGAYPALYLSSFRPIETLKSAFRVGAEAAIPRKVLVVLQFTISIGLIIGTIVVYRQIRFAQLRPAGYDSNGLITITRTPDLEKHFQSFRRDLKTEGLVTDAALVVSPPTESWADDIQFDWQGRNPGSTPDINIGSVTPEYGKIIGWQLKEGRDFDASLATDSAALILNESAVRLTGFQHPIGQTIQWRGRPYHVIGVIRDIIVQSPFQSSTPFIFHISGGQKNFFVVLRVNPSLPVQSALARIGSVYSRYEPIYPIDYQFVDREYAKKFGDEVRIGRLSLLFTLFAIGISCLGLFGMASYMAERRRKEIGVRKVLGASTFALWRLLTREFLLLVALALLIAAPLAGFGMQKWLQQYPGRTHLTWWVFAAAGGGAILITLATVSYQTVKAALANPTRSLRAE